MRPVFLEECSDQRRGVEVGDQRRCSATRSLTGALRLGGQSPRQPLALRLLHEPALTQIGQRVMAGIGAKRATARPRIVTTTTPPPAACWTYRLS